MFLIQMKRLLQKSTYTVDYDTVVFHALLDGTSGQLLVVHLFMFESVGFVK